MSDRRRLVFLKFSNYGRHIESILHGNSFHGISILHGYYLFYMATVM